MSLLKPRTQIVRILPALPEACPRLVSVLTPDFDVDNWWLFWRFYSISMTTFIVCLDAMELQTWKMKNQQALSSNFNFHFNKDYYWIDQQHKWLCNVHHFINWTNILDRSVKAVLNSDHFLASPLSCTFLDISQYCCMEYLWTTKGQVEHCLKILLLKNMRNATIKLLKKCKRIRHKVFI